MDINSNEKNTKIRRDHPLSGVRFRVVKPGDRREIWLPELDIIFMLGGSGRVSFQNGVVFGVKQEDIFAVNSFEICSLDLDVGSTALSMTISSDVIAALHPEILRYEINCRSFLVSDENSADFDVIRKDVANAFCEMYKNDSSDFYPRSRITRLLEDLSKYFVGEEKAEFSKCGSERIKMAADYILENYKEEITLESLSKHIYLSETYISRSFPKFFGVSFLEYVTQVRLTHAASDMRTGMSLTDIAYNNGFSSENMMIRAFKKYRGTTPGEYRKALSDSTKTLSWRDTDVTEIPSVDDYLGTVFKFAGDGESQRGAAATKSMLVDVNFSSRKHKTENHFRRIINAGYARSILEAEVQKELKFLMKKVGYKYVRIKGLLDDDMMVYRYTRIDKVIMNFNYVDEAIDFILSLGAKPMLELGHMPGALAVGEGLFFLRPANAKITDNLSEWTRLINSLMKHLDERYGSKRMSSWIFVPWITSDFISDLGTENYMKIYKISYDAIKSVSSELLTCHSFSLHGTEDNRFERIFPLLEEYDCVPEIFATRAYNSLLEGGDDDTKLIENLDSFDFAVSKDKDYLANNLKRVKSYLKKKGLEHMPILVDECNSNIWQRDLCSDTCYKAAWFMKTMLENEENCNGIAYFSVNDRLDEVFPMADQFHGGFGLFTPDGIPKAVAVAACLLGRAGNYLIKKGEGYFISYDSEKEIYQIYLYNYVHYDKLYRYRHMVNISRCSRYRVFENDDDIFVTLRITGLNSGFLKKRVHKITREHGSSYDAWVRMGAPQRLDDEEKEILLHAADPEYRTERIEINDKEPLVISESLKPHEVALIELIVDG